MPATLTTITSRVGNLIGNNVAVSTATLQQLIQAENESIVGDWSWAEKRGEGILVTVPTYTTGTIATSGTTVTGTGTTFTSSMVGRWMTFDTQSAYYQITAVGSATNLTIESAVAGGDLAAGTPYVIFQHVYSLPTNAERLLTVVGGQGGNYLYTLQEVTRQDLDRLDPARSTRTSTPQYYTYRSRDSNGNWQIEVWPVPSAAYLLRLAYLKTGTLVAGTDTTLYRSDILVYKAASAAAFMLFGLTGDQTWATLGNKYFEIYKDQLTGALADDLGHSSAASHVREWDSVLGVGSDFWISHDIGIGY